MDLLEIINIFDEKLEREIVNITNYMETLSYANTYKLKVIIDNEEYTPIRLCLVPKNEGVYLYINTINRKYHKKAIASIESIEIES